MLTIRDVTECDRAAYEAMSRDFYSGDAVLYPISREKLDATFAQALGKSPLMRLVMLEDEGETVGYGNLSFTWSTEAGGVVCWVEEIYIQPQQRSKGYGKAFLAWVEQAYSGVCKRYRLEVCPHNPQAKRLYESIGYEMMEYLPMVKDVN